jgi:hypothetical protein
MFKYPVVLLLVGLSLLVFVPQEGMAQGREEEALTSDPFLYGLASFILPGLGQYLNGQRGKAIAHFLIAVAIPVTCYYAAFFTSPLPIFPICTLLSLAWHAYSGIDAYETAATRRSARLLFVP